MAGAPVIPLGLRQEVSNVFLLGRFPGGLRDADAGCGLAVLLVVLAFSIAAAVAMVWFMYYVAAELAAPVARA
jgi:hypothetical protein